MNFKYSLDNKRYHTLNYELTTKFNTRVFKVSLNGGFSCPNIKNNKGCIFCSDMGSGDFAGNKNDDLEVQFNEIKNKLNNKWPDTKYIAYFQANTNTYAPVDVLKEKFEKVLLFKNVVGLNIGTRPDAISEECLKYLIDLNKRTYLTVEIGLQSMYDETLKLINRGHDLKCFDNCIKKLRDNNINVVVHIINGLPGETKEMMINTVKHLNKLDIQGIKIHMLHILRNTELEHYYKKTNFHILTKEEYINIVCDQIEELNDNIVIHRLTGDGVKEDLIEPIWTLKKVSVLNDIDKELDKRGTYQGFNKTIYNKIELICNKFIKQGDITVDATCVNDEDIMLLSKLSKKLLALTNDNNVLQKKFPQNVEIINNSYDDLESCLKDYYKKISLVLFNLSNISKCAKKPCFNLPKTKNSIKQSINILNKKGMILIICDTHNANIILEDLKNNNINYKNYNNSINNDDLILIEISN